MFVLISRLVALTSCPASNDAQCNLSGPLSNFGQLHNGMPLTAVPPMSISFNAAQPSQAGWQSSVFHLWCICKGCVVHGGHKTLLATRTLAYLAHTHYAWQAQPFDKCVSHTTGTFSHPKVHESVIWSAQAWEAVASQACMYRPFTTHTTTGLRAQPSLVDYAASEVPSSYCQGQKKRVLTTFEERTSPVLAALQ